MIAVRVEVMVGADVEEVFLCLITKQLSVLSCRSRILLDGRLATGGCRQKAVQKHSV